MLLQEMVRRMKALLKGQEGQGLAEYALILVLVSLVAIGTMTLLGTDISGVFTKISAKLTGAV